MTVWRASFCAWVNPPVAPVWSFWAEIRPGMLSINSVASARCLSGKRALTPGKAAAAVTINGPSRVKISGLKLNLRGTAIDYLL